MPKPETLRRHFPDCGLSAEKMVEVTEWLRDYLGQEHVTPTNKTLRVLIDWEDRKVEDE